MIVGSVNAKHTASLGSIGSANVSVVRAILLAVLGKGTMLLLSKSYISLLNGFRKRPKKQDIFDMSISARENFFFVYSSPEVKMNDVAWLS